MAVLDNFRPAPVAASRGLVAKFITSSIASVQAWNDARVTRKALSQLTARELSDIGLDAGDIDRITRR